MEQTDLDCFFQKTQTVLETAYLEHTEPWRQSGMSGPEERWVSLRRPIADCLEHSGSFLDIGCANGYLLECLLKWTAARGLNIEPFGLDLSPRLAELARQRLPRHAGQVYTGNSWYWTPPQQFDYVRSELCCVPSEYERRYVDRLLDLYVKPGGQLLVPNYAEDHPNPERGVFPENYPTKYLLDRLADLGLTPLDYRDGFDTIKGRKVRLAILTHASR